VGELSEVEREASRVAWKVWCGLDETGDREAKAWHSCWDAACDYYAEDKARVERAHGECSIELVEAKARERALREALETIAAAASRRGARGADGYAVIEARALNALAASPQSDSDTTAEALNRRYVESDHGLGVTAEQIETAAYLTAALGVPAKDGVVGCKRGDQEFFLRPDGTLESGFASLDPGEFDGLPHQVGRSDHGPGEASEIDRLRKALQEITETYSLNEPPGVEGNRLRALALAALGVQEERDD
jgi:hypothetical protein